MNRMLAQLDRRLDQRGEAIVLRKQTISGSIRSNVDCTIPAIVRSLTVEQILGNLTQTNYFIIISPTHIIRAQWPGGRTPAATGNLIDASDPRIPAINDVVMLRGAQKSVQRVAPIFDAGECIRIEMTVTG